MPAPKSDTVFAGSVPEVYERSMVPLIFEPYAVDMAKRVAAQRPSRVLEIACGTGVVTRQLAVMLGEGAQITATDLNPAMLEQAQRIPTARPVTWRAADAMNLPFENGSFDAVVCQFGAMFFPDRPHAYGEVRRVLRPGGVFAFNVWGPIAANDFAACISEALAALWPANPPDFMARTPHGYNDAKRIADDLAKAGYTATPRIENVAFMSRAVSAHEAAFAYCHGTPWRGEVEARDPASGLERATRAAEDALVKRFGAAEIEGRIEALVVTVSA
jgi:SAM-dependent methyltransferase